MAVSTTSLPQNITTVPHHVEYTAVGLVPPLLPLGIDETAAPERKQDGDDDEQDASPLLRAPISV